MLNHAEKLLKDILKFEQPSERITSQYFRKNKQLGARDRAILLDTIYKVIREKSLLEHLAQTQIGSKGAERQLAILAWQGGDEWLNKMLSPEEQAWLIEANKLAVEELPTSVRYSLPEWLFQRLEQELGDEVKAFASSMLQSAPLDLRVNSLKSKAKAIQEQLSEEGVVGAELTSYSPIGLRIEGKPNLSQHPLYLDGTIEVQDEGSQLLSLLFNAKRNEVVIDYCAGAGGKTLAIGAAMRNTGRVYAWDLSAHRLDALKPRLERSGLTNVHTAAIAHGDEPRVRRLHGKADRVLVDAPCSGLGTLRRSPELKWRQNQQSITELAETQAQILAEASQLVKKGGLLVYATCSVLQEENEEVAQQFNTLNSDFEKLDIVTLLEAQRVPQAENLVRNGYLRLWPHFHQTDGFFAAAWIRK